MRLEKIYHRPLENDVLTQKTDIRIPRAYNSVVLIRDLYFGYSAINLSMTFGSSQ